MRLGVSGKGALFFFLFSLIITLVSSSASAQDGKALFEKNCKTCHDPIKTRTGPALKGVKAAWEEADPGMVYIWVRNYKEAVSKSAYAAKVVNKMPSNMNPFPDLTDEDIDAIFAYVEAYEPPAGTDEAGGGVAGEDEGGMSNWWYIIFIVLLIVIFAAASFRRQLAQIQKEKDGEEVDLDESYGQTLKAWALRNQGAVSVLGLVSLFALLVVTYGWLKGIGVYEGYQPTQPVAGFSHNIHADVNGIDCQYCHNSASKSKHAGLPTMNVCMNCHKDIEGVSDDGVKGVAYLRAHAGYNGETGQYDGEKEPIVWNRVYVLPDHAYFNHSQHITVGGLDCVNCHGEVKNMTTAKVIESKDAVPVEGLPENQLTRPTLTMGWCIECHGNLGVGLAGSENAYYEEIHRRLKKRPDVYKKYLDDEKVTVGELGGWECSKCHY